MSYMTYEEWRDFLKSPGAWALMPHSAIDKPCPKCNEHKGYSITRDGYAYCEACCWGCATDGVWTNKPLEILKPDGKTDTERMQKLYGNIKTGWQN